VSAFRCSSCLVRLDLPLELQEQLNFLQRGQLARARESPPVAVEQFADRGQFSLARLGADGLAGSVLASTLAGQR
jgi:hypothetical protein